MPSVLRDLPSSAALTPEPHFDPWEEHEHLMNPMFLQVETKIFQNIPKYSKIFQNIPKYCKIFALQSPDELDLPPLDPELLDHQRRRGENEEDPQDLQDGQGAVPPPKQLTLERQLNKSILIGWNSPDCPPGIIEMYHVYVDGFLKTTVRASDKTRALVEGVDSTKVGAAANILSLSL